VHSHELADFVYREQKRLDRNCNLTRSEQIQLSFQAVERLKCPGRSRTFRCIQGPKKYDDYHMRNYRYRSRQEPREEMMEQLALARV